LKARGDPVKQGPKPLYTGVITCSGCHSLKKPEETKGPPPIVCRCNEALIWGDKDKHNLAYTNLFLSDGRGAQMIKLLNYSKDDVNRRCVVCHGVYLPADRIDALTDRSFKRDQSEGVNCVVCHGAYADWILPHGSPLEGDRETWRKLSRKQKEDRYGMTDLWDAGKRSLKCASCHIGSTEEGKVVTHTMYAAGHPPLPGLEVSTFSDAMPRHWEYLREKKSEAQRLLQYDPSELEITRLVITGGVVDFQAAMELLASQAEVCAQEKEPQQRVLDLAHFDCYACHHDLKSPGWRQKRGYSGPPGRPQFRPWPLALVKLAVHQSRQAEKAAELTEKLRQLHQAFDRQPFGRPADVARAARDLAGWATQLRASISAAKCDKATALDMLHQLDLLALSETPDYDTARQMAWAFVMIYKECNPQSEQDAAFQKQWKALDDELGLRLPATQQQKLLQELPRALQKINDYDPERFKKTFASVCGALLKEK
jgi:hypothetical protein